MTKKISIFASTLLLCSSALFADSSSIIEAVKNGSTTGELTLYNTVTDEENKDKEGFTASTININYETDRFNGFKAMLGFRAGLEFAEEEDGNYEDDFEEDALLHTAAISYTNDDFSISLGRQEIDVSWLEDYNESILAHITAVEDTTIILAYADKQAEAEEDEISDFEEVTEDGAYVLEVVNHSFENLEFIPYYYNIVDEVDFYGLQARYNHKWFSFSAHYADSNIDSSAKKLEGKEDGNVLHLEMQTDLKAVTLTAGYITTDKDGGIGGMDTYGENIDPTEELDDAILDEVDSNTLYGLIAYEIADVELTALYADVEYGSEDKDANELSLMIEYNFTEELAFEASYSDAKIDHTDIDVFSAQLVYSF